MAYTSHGHHVPGTMEDAPENRRPVARCGGLRLCAQCKNEAASVFGMKVDRGEGLCQEELNRRFGSRTGDEALMKQHATMATSFMEFAQLLSQYLPEGRYKSLALTELENASMWAHKSLGLDSDG